jgi:predicted nucleic acid-binding protein
VAAAAHLVVTPLILAELDYRLTTRIGPEAAQGAVAHIRDHVAVRRYAVPEIEPYLSTALVTMRRYPQFGLTDTMNVVMASEYHTDSILTLDRCHFRMVRFLTKCALTVRPHRETASTTDTRRSPKAAGVRHS